MKGRMEPAEVRLSELPYLKVAAQKAVSRRPMRRLPDLLMALTLLEASRAAG